MSMLALIRRHDVIRGLPRWLTILTAGATALLGLITYSAARGLTTAPELLIALIWLFAASYVLGGQDRRRCGDLEATLPIPARRLWLANLAALLTAGLISLALIIGLSSGALRLLDGLERGLVRPFPEPRDLLLLSSGFLLLLAWRESDHRDRPANWTDGLFQLVVILALILVLTSRPTASFLLLLLPALLLLWRSWRSLPAAFEARRPARGVRTSPPRIGTAAGGFETGGGAPPLLLQTSTLLLATAKHPAALVLGYGFLFGFGLLLGGIYTDLVKIRLTFLPITAYLIVTLMGKPLQLLGSFDSLPLSRRRMLGLLLLPCVGLLGLGFLAGDLGARHGGSDRERIRFLRTEEADLLVVPGAVCELAFDGLAPPAESPWGESHPVWSAEIMKGSRVRIYSPFSAPAGSSPRFFAWQLSRAAKAVYGVDLDPETLQERFLEHNAAGALRIREEQVLADEFIALVAQYPELRPLRGAPWFPLLIGLATLAALLLMPPYLRSFRAGLKDSRRNVALFTMLGGLLLLHLGVFSLLMAGLVQDFLLGDVVEILFRGIETAWPAARLGFWLVMILSLAGAWRIALRAFARAELPAKAKTACIL
jgi:hypothetical protein